MGNPAELVCSINPGAFKYDFCLILCLKQLLLACSYECDGLYLFQV